MIIIRKVVHVPTTVVILENAEGMQIGEVPVVNARTPLEACDAAAAFIDASFYHDFIDLEYADG